MWTDMLTTLPTVGQKVEILFILKSNPLVQEGLAQIQANKLAFWSPSQSGRRAVLVSALAVGFERIHWRPLDRDDLPAEYDGETWATWLTS